MQTCSPVHPQIAHRTRAVVMLSNPNMRGWFGIFHFLSRVSCVAAAWVCGPLMSAAQSHSAVAALATFTLTASPDSSLVAADQVHPEYRFLGRSLPSSVL
jgi:hypothetical protein